MRNLSIMRDQLGFTTDEIDRVYPNAAESIPVVSAPSVGMFDMNPSPYSTNDLP